MNCPRCNSADTKVVDSRSSEGGKAIRRRRECPHCGYRFTSYERPEQIRLMVTKRSGTREPFDAEKIRAGIVKACVNRPAERDPAVIEQMMSDIESEVRGRYINEIASEDIGRMVMKRLEALDKVAYLRFASVYKQFAHPEQFKEEAEKIAREGEEQ